MPLSTPSKPPASIHLSRVAAGARASPRRAKDVGMASLCPASLLILRTHKPRPNFSLRSPRRKVLAMVGVGMGVVNHSPRKMCITSPLPQVGGGADSSSFTMNRHQ